MRKILRSLLLIALLAAALCMSALAADTVEGGIYNVSGSATLTPKNANNDVITAGSDTTAVSGYYANAVKFDVTGTGMQDGSQYLLLVLKGEGDSAPTVPTETNIAYIDQAAATSEGVSFTAYPKELTMGKYYVYLVGGDTAFDAAAPAATFSYDQKYTLGDVNSDNAIDSGDALLVLKHSVHLISLNETQQLAADVNKDGSIDSGDALLILKYSVHLIDKF